MSQHTVKVSIAQISPVWLNQKETIVKIIAAIDKAGKEKSDLITFGEGFLPGYPFWLSFTHASQFESEVQKDIHAKYISEAVDIEAGDLNSISKALQKHQMACYLGVIEKAKNRGGHSLYCSLVYFGENGKIESVHRKLMPTYEERLAWSSGDGHGLQVHPLKGFTVGGLNCWENWMPLPRAALYGMGENLHVAVWPGSDSNTQDITRFIAKEGRSFVISASSILQKGEIPTTFPHFEHIIAKAPETMANGGSCIAGPDGEWIIPPSTQKEEMLYATLDLNKVLKERQNFDPAGHYSRPDVTQLTVNRTRQSTINIID